MAKTASGFRKNEKIIACQDLVGVPRGTKGKIKLINGVTWKRYWVFFDNGVQRGSIDGSQLVRASEWDMFRRNNIATAVETPTAEVAEVAAAPAAGAAAAEGGSKIPAHLLERSKKAKAAKGGAPADASAADAPSPAASEAASKVPAHLLERAAAAKAKKAAG